MDSYQGDMVSAKDFVDSLYRDKGFNKSKYLSKDEIVTICQNIGIFKLKGYVREIRSLPEKNIDDVMYLYFFDKYFSKILFDLTIRIESKLKSILIDECYALTRNHFFYLEQRNHKWSNYRIDFATLKNWEIQSRDGNQSEHYRHYIQFYLKNYDFSSNKQRYLNNRGLLNDLDESRYNYPPFKYLVESATLGSVNSFIGSLKINSQDIDKKVSHHFGVGNTEIFRHYLERLNEIRNRVAHGGRMFNRTYRSATGIGKFQSFRQSINNHKSMDVFLFLHYMLNRLERYRNFEDFKRKHVAKLFGELKKDRLSDDESFGLSNKYTKKDTERIKKVILRRMSN